MKCSNQFRVNKRDTDCFEYRYEENTKLSVNASVSYAWIFLSTLFFLWFFYVLVLLNSNLQKQQSKGDTWGMKLKVFPFELRNFWCIVYFILELLSKLNSFEYNLLDVICISRNKLFQHDGILYPSWLAFTVYLLLSQRTSLHR